MPTLRILADGESPQAAAQARGKLFEKLMAEVLRQAGYTIGKIASVNYAGMEIDIEGHHTLTGVPMYAECKCYDTPVDSPKLQAFFGKYMSRWLREPKSHGLFIALPSINTHARGFYNENCRDSRMTLQLLEEERVVALLLDSKLVVPIALVENVVSGFDDRPGDQSLLCTDRGNYWVQLLIPEGAAIPKRMAVITDKGVILTESGVIDHLAKLLPDLAAFERILPTAAALPRRTSIAEDPEEIVEVRGSSSCFEYQFPASPQHFVGRQAILSAIDAFLQKTTTDSVSSRGLLLEANSGWGKSSVVLNTVDRQKMAGHFAVAIDSRSASSPKFVLRVIEHVIGKFADADGIFPPKGDPLTGFHGAIERLVAVGNALKAHGRFLLIFFDQFENLFFLPDVLRHIRDLLLKIIDAQTNVVLGFCWKTDFLGLPLEFPHQLQSAIADSSQRFQLDTFSDIETDALLARLAKELRTPLRKDLKFLLAEFSQGYPWLLKKLCAHVKSQREAGVQQAEIAESVLNVEALFQEDLKGLTAAQEDALRQIAKVVPVNVSDLGDQFKPEVVQVLVNRRLIVRVANKYDIYWDIFRDYLNTGRIPTQQNYMLRMQLGSVLKTAKLLESRGGRARLLTFRTAAGLSEGGFANVLRDLKLLGLVKIETDELVLQAKIAEGKDVAESLRVYVRDRLSKNRLVQLTMSGLASDGTLSREGVAGILAAASPYVVARSDTWDTYARILLDWMDFADLVTFDAKAGLVRPYTPGAELRERRPSLQPRRSRSVQTLAVQFRPVEEVARRFSAVLRGEAAVNIREGFTESTWSKALYTLEDLGFIRRLPRSIQFTEALTGLAGEPSRLQAGLRKAALEMPSFRVFVELLDSCQESGASHAELAVALRSRLGVDWRDGTARTVVKIMLDWCRQLGIAPGRFAKTVRRRRRGDQQGFAFS